MPGARRVNIGRDAAGNVIITGDGNQFFVIAGVKEISSELVSRLRGRITDSSCFEGADLVQKPVLFVSYIRECGTWINEFAKEIHLRNTVELWLDTYEIDPGDSWIDRIGNALTGASGCLVCIGKEFPSHWQMNEIRHALILKGEKPHFRIVPLIMPGGSLQFLPVFLKGYQAVDCNEGLSVGEAADQISAAFAGQYPQTTGVVDTALAKKAALELIFRDFQELKGKIKLNDKVVVETESQLMAEWLQETRKAYLGS